MINIKVSNGVPYVWDPQEWLKLRKDHRIVGVLDGPCGNGLNGRMRYNLPMRLTQVEVQYLVDQGICRTTSAPSLRQQIPIIDEQTLEKVNKERKHKLLEEYKKKRKNDIEIYLDKMVEGKKKKGRMVEDVTDKDAFVQKELDKITETPYEMYRLDLQDPWLNDDDYLPYDFPLPRTYLEKLKYRVFKDFHLHRKYWVTPGCKFGGDFLAYPGDPRYFHAEFIIMCRDKDEPKFSHHIVSQCRLAISVKKILLIATVDETNDKLMYHVPKTSSYAT